MKRLICWLAGHKRVKRSVTYEGVTIWLGGVKYTPADGKVLATYDLPHCGRCGNLIKP